MNNHNNDKPSLLYISNFHDGTGWSHAASDYVRCLEPFFNITCKSIKLNKHNELCDPYIQKFFGDGVPYYDFCIQHVLPHYYSKTENANISVLLFANETSKGLPLNWKYYVEMADIPITISYSMADILNKQNLVNKHIYGVPQPVDLHKYLSFEYKVNTQIRRDNTFIFYTISEHNNRKNIPAILKAFHSEFGPEDNVGIFIKSNVGANISQVANQIKDQLFMRKHYINELIVEGYMSEEDILNVHYTCDAFVSASCGEAWCMPAVDAMGVGRHIIVPYSTGFKDYAKQDDAVSTVNGACFGQYPYDSNCSWEIVVSSELRTQMRKVYETKPKANYIDVLEQFSSNKVGATLYSILMGAL